MKKNLLTLLLMISSFSLMWAADINYKFTNSTVTYSGTGEGRIIYYEFDIQLWVEQNTAPVYMNNGMIYFEYNTNTFGEALLVENNKIEIQPLGPLNIDYYNKIYADNTVGIIAITYESITSSKSIIENNYEVISNNPADPSDIFHIKIEVSELGQTGIKWSYADTSFYNPNLQTYFDISGENALSFEFEGFYEENTTENDVIFLDGNGDPALPVTLESFIANYKQGAVELDWATASETQNMGFVLKRALLDDGAELQYETIASYMNNDDLIGAGTTTERNVYAYSDRTVRPGNSYSYILEDVDYSGNVVQHDPVSVVIPENVLAATDDFRLQPAYPNPFNPAFTLPFTLNRAMDVRIAMYDLSGRQVRSIANERLDAGTYNMHVNAGDLNSGIYFVRSIIGDQVHTQKLLLVK